MNYFFIFIECSLSLSLFRAHSTKMTNGLCWLLNICSSPVTVKAVNYASVNIIRYRSFCFSHSTMRALLYYIFKFGRECRLPPNIYDSDENHWSLDLFEVCFDGMDEHRSSPQLLLPAHLPILIRIFYAISHYMCINLGALNMGLCDADSLLTFSYRNVCTFVFLKMIEIIVEFQYRFCALLELAEWR